jgi:hypothetical protein
LSASFDAEALLFKRDRRSGSIPVGNITVSNGKNRRRNATLAGEVNARKLMISLQFFGNPMELAGVPDLLIAAPVERYLPQAAANHCFSEQNWNIRTRSAICG